MAENEMGMVERVARALCEQDGGREWQHFIMQAKAAIAAMREPTEAMMREVSPSCPYDPVDIAETWRTMIDTALTE